MEGNYTQQLLTIPDTSATTKKVGRPRKSDSKNTNFKYCIPEKKTPSIPLKAPDGLYWCKECHRHFQKPRQFSVHVCLSTESQDKVMDHLEDDNDLTEDFKLSMYVDRYPWSRIRKAQNKKKATENLESVKDESTECLEKDVQEEIITRVSNWKDDPLYVPLFNSGSEKEAFKKHLKAIDYSCVDVLFHKLEQKSNIQFNKKRKTESITKYSCITCKKVFKSLCHIRMHCLTHTDLKPFACPKCSYRCNVQAGLYTHMRTHTGNLFRCSQCNFQSTKRSHLLDHEQTHSTVSVCCKLCKNMYKNLKSLIFHVKKYHDGASGKKYIKSLSLKQINKCDVCGKTFTTNSSFESHKKYFHSSSKNLEQLNDQNIKEKDSENPLDYINLTDYQILSDSNTLINEPSELVLSEEFNKLESEHSFNDSCTSFDNIVCSDTSLITTSVSLGSQNQPENSFETSGAFQKSPFLLDCSVMLKPLDDQLVNYHQYSYKCVVCSQSFSSKAVLENHEMLNHSSSISSEQLKAQEMTQNISENAFENLDFTDKSALSSLLKCSVRIKPLDDQLVELTLNNLLQQKSVQNEERFDNAFQRSDSQNILNSNKLLNETVSANTSSEKLISINGESFSSKVDQNSCEILDVFSVSAEELNTQEVNQKLSENSFEDISFTDTPALSSLLKCSVRIKPLESQLVGLMLNKFLQQKSAQNVELFDNVFPQSESQNTCNSNTVLNKTISPSTTPEKLIDISNKPISSKVLLENCQSPDNSSTVPSGQLNTQENLKISESSFENIGFTDTASLLPLLNCTVRIEPLDNQLVGLYWNNLLQQKNEQFFQSDQSEPNTILNEAISPSTIPEELLPINNVDQFDLANASMLEECCTKLDIINECIRQSNIASEDITEASYQTADPKMAKQQSSTFEISGMPLNFTDDQVMLQSISENSSEISKTVHVDSEQKSEEIKLFEKCQRAPAYVCCVCSSIFICTSTLKAHLKEHVNKTNSQTSVIEYPVNDFKPEELTTNDPAINSVCSILQDSSNSDVENELEKLYTSSLHKRWYLPEVSVVLENDQSLIDSFLDEFPINDKFDDQENLPLESVIFS